MSNKFLIILATLTALASAQSRGTFYLIPSASSFTIYNEFEQSLSADDLARFAPYAPLQLVEPNVLLGDGISRAGKFRMGNSVYFLLRDGSGGYSGAAGKKEPLILGDCEVLSDTVEVTRGGVLTVAPVTGPVRRVPAGPLVRIFRRGGRCYVFLPDDPPCFGWCSLDPSGAWRRVRSSAASEIKTPPPSAGISDILQEKIRAMIEAANQDYRRFFFRFDSLTGSGKSVPQWLFEPTASQCRCTLATPYDDGDYLPESTRELRTGIENLLSGTGFILTGGKGEIVVKKQERRQ